MIEIGIVLLYGAFKGLADWEMKNNGSSWVNKYSKGLESIPSGLYGWYHKMNGLSYREKFFGSGSFLVMFTDFWHFWNTCRHLCIYALVYLINPTMWWLSIPAFMIGFGASYKLLHWVKR